MSTSLCLSCSYSARAGQAARGSPQEIHSEQTAERKPRCHPPDKRHSPGEGRGPILFVIIMEMKMNKINLL